MIITYHILRRLLDRPYDGDIVRHVMDAHYATVTELVSRETFVPAGWKQWWLKPKSKDPDYYLTEPLTHASTPDVLKFGRFLWRCILLFRALGVPNI